MSREEDLAEFIIQRHDWNWLSRYGDEVAEELATVYALGYEEEMARPQQRQVEAGPATLQWASLRAAELLSATGEASLLWMTQQRVRTVLVHGLSQGLGVRAIARELEKDIGFSRSRADMIAQTETISAMAQGGKGAALSQGRDEKRWETQGTASVCEICLGNEGNGWISIVDSFSSGHGEPAAHPRCRCAVTYRTSELSRFVSGLLKVARCPTCRWKAAENVNIGAQLWCKRCNKEFEAASLLTTA